VTWTFSYNPNQNSGGSATLTITCLPASFTVGTSGANVTFNPTSTTVNYGSTTSLTLTPATGYSISTVTGCGNSWSNTSGGNSGKISYTTGAITAACTVTATATLANETVTVTQNGGVGTVTCCGSGCSNNWLSNATASYSITPPNGLVLSSVSVTPAAFSANSSGPTGALCGGLQFPVNSANQTLTVSYGHGDTVTKTTYTNGTLDSPVNSGGGTISSCATGGSDTWADNATASYALIPAPGYVLATISQGPTNGPYNSSVSPPAGGYTCSSPLTFNVGVSAQALTAYFATKETVTPTVNTNGALSGTGGTVTSCNGSNSWGQNSTAYYAVTPASGYMLQSIGVSPAGSFTPLSPGGYSCGGVSYQFNVGTNNQALTVNFVQSSNVQINGTAINGGDIKVGAYNGPSTVSSYSVQGNTSQTFYFIPPSGKGISSVSYDGNVITQNVQCPNGDFTSPGTSNATACTYTTNVGTTGHTISVTYDTAYQVSITTSTSGCNQNSGGGFIGGTAPGVTSQTINVVNGKAVSFTLSPNSGFVLNNLTLGGASQLAQPQFAAYTYTSPAIRSNTAVVAFFTPFYTISTQMISATGTTATGTISPSTAQVVCGNSSPPFTITPTAPASIQDVSVNTGSGLQSQGVISSYTFSNVQSNSTLQATFTQEAFLLSNYSIIPPFVQAAVLPNLLLMIDNSASQYDLQYDSTGQCYDNNSYVDGTTYYGYFNNSTYYSFTAANRFEPLPAGTSMPGTCTFRTPFFCVQMGAGTPVSQGGTRTMASITLSNGTAVNGFIASGNFLNYLATSKLDLQKMILTGGKYDSPTTSLIAESRGCMGKRFVKLISKTQAVGSSEDLSGLTFVVRGPNASDPDYVNPVVQNGTTRIDIYDGTYNLSSCQNAMKDSSYVDACLANPVGGSNLKGNTIIHVLHVCVKGAGNGNMNSVEHDCNADWQTNYGPNPAVASSLIINPQGGDAICSSVMNHSLVNGRDTGYLGLCCNPGVTDCSKSQNWDGTCESNQMADFCQQMQSSQVVDPSGTTSVTSGNLPSFVIDAGVDALGPAVADYLVKVDQSTPPTGLIQQFQNFINFGVMTFNYDGAGSECNDGVLHTTSPIPCSKACSVSGTACYLDADCPSGQSCSLVTKTDGGQIPAGRYIGDPVGDHTTGLIHQLDIIPATSWTPFAEAYYDAIGYFANDTTKRLQTNDWDATKPPPSASCILNNILIITDGASTADQATSVNTLAGQYNDGVNFGSCPNYMGSKNVAALAYAAYNRNIRNLSQALDRSNPSNPPLNNQYITTYVAYSGPNAVSATDGCDPYNLMNNTAMNGSGGNAAKGLNGVNTLYYATTYPTMVANLRSALQKISTSSASGTAASILNNSQGSGANLLQAVFFPTKVFSYKDSSDIPHEDVVNWIGELQNLWFYVDPYLGNSTVREDTNQDYILSLKNDYVASFGYAQNQAQVKLAQDVNGDGSSLVYKSTVTLDGLHSLWAAGRSLWNRNLSTDPRNIYTLLGTPNVNGTITGTLQKVSSVDSDGFNTNPTAQSYLQVAGSSSTDLKNNTNTLVNYLTGTDQPGYRARAVTIPDCGLTDSEGCKREWKLGDIVNSTPKLDSNIPINTYALTAPSGYLDTTYSTFTGSTNYVQRGMAFVGGNDGMLHAFRLGILDVTPQLTTSGTVDTDKKARMMWPYGTTASYSTSNLGREEWAYIPTDALPYLKYLGDPNYTHLYYVDQTVTISDMSIAVPTDNDNVNYPNCSSASYWNCQKKTTLASDGSLNMDKTSWRTVLIGGMGLGGATHDATSSCVDNVATGTCVKTPITNTNGTNGNVGYSSYFALDVTNPASLPGTSGGVKVLWEFNGNGQLGYSLSGPAIVRIGPKDQNGRWYAIFGSGPTGPIENTSHTFYGKSDQSLKLFVVDVATGELVRTIDTNLQNAFAGSITGGVIDTDRNYSDDAVYISYVQADTSVTPNTWTQGGVLRLLTHQSSDPAGKLDPNNAWTVRTLISGIGPITTSVAKLQDTNVRYGSSQGKLWLYFGTGRYFYKTDMSTPSTPFQIFGITDPCYSRHSSGMTPTGPTNAYAPNCTDYVSVDSLVPQTGSASAAPSSTIDPAAPGWYVNLASSETVNNNFFSAERVITNPNANANGTVFFSTLLPSTDICGVGGETYIWAFKYDTGATPLSATMKGNILLQVSTGDLEMVNLANAFSNPTNQGYNLRRLSVPISGVPPTGSGMVGMNRPQPTKKLLHIQEK